METTDLKSNAVSLFSAGNETSCGKQVHELVRSFLGRSREFLNIARDSSSASYIFEPAILRERAGNFLSAFRMYLQDFEAFFPIKCNNHPDLIIEAVHSGLGLDVSSGMELEAALGTGCNRILFSGPGKTNQELDLAVQNNHRVLVLMDSFGELERLNDISGNLGRQTAAGIRLNTGEEGPWRRFGIHLTELGSFLEESTRNSHVRLEGLQFHSSWNLDPVAQVRFIQKLGGALSQLAPELTRDLRFLDIGGGYWPEAGEWLLRDREKPFNSTHLLRERSILPAAPVRDFAREINRALEDHVFPTISLQIWAEPGRWIANDSVHILIRVADKKADDIAVTEAGTNIVGWEKYEKDFAPVINISRPSLEEHPCLITGSLCTPHDVWGWSYFGDGIEPGDVLLLPNQGAYTWSLQQQFIKPTASMVTLQTS